MVLGDKWEVAIKVVVELDGPVVARVNCPFVENCGEGGWRIYQSGCWWVRNGKWQQSEYGIHCVMAEKWAVAMNIWMGQWWPESVVHLWKIVGKVVGQFTRVVGDAW